MDQDLLLKGKIYISSKRAAYFSGFAKDYIAEMLRSGKIEGTKVSRNWYVSQDSLLEYLKNNDNERYEKFKTKLNVEKRVEDQKKDLEPEKKTESNQPIVFNIPSPVIPFAEVATHSSFKSLLTYALGPIAVSSIIASFLFLFLTAAFYAGDFNISMPKGLQALFLNTQESNVADLPAYGQNENLLSRGMVVMPQTETDVEAQLESVKKAFSDEVVVTPDSSGTSGVITPVFKERNGNDYLYVLVPVKEDKKPN